MREEEALEYVGTDVFVVNYQERVITTRTITGTRLVYGGGWSDYQLEAGNETLPYFKESYEEAVQSLVKHYEIRFNVASDQLKEVMNLQEIIN